MCKNIPHFSTYHTGSQIVLRLVSTIANLDNISVHGDIKCFRIASLDLFLLIVKYVFVRQNS